MTNDTMADDIDEAITRIGAYDPDDIAFFGAVLVVKGDVKEIQLPGEDEVTETTGFAIRLMADDLAGFDGTKDVLVSVGAYHERLDEITYPVGADDASDGGPDSNPLGELAAMLSGANAR